MLSKTSQLNCENISGDDPESDLSVTFRFFSFGLPAKEAGSAPNSLDLEICGVLQ